MSSLTGLISGGGASYVTQSLGQYVNNWYSSTTLTISPPTGKRVRLLQLRRTNANFAYLNCTVGTRTMFSNKLIETSSRYTATNEMTIGVAHGPFIYIEGDTDEDIVFSTGTSGAFGGLLQISWEIL